MLLPRVDEHEREGFYATGELDLRMGETACGVPLRSLNDEAVWTLSTARPGNGIAELLASGVSVGWARERSGPAAVGRQAPPPTPS